MMVALSCKRVFQYENSVSENNLFPSLINPNNLLRCFSPFVYILSAVRYSREVVERIASMYFLRMVGESDMSSRS